jgi:hypothetical protein
MAKRMTETGKWRDGWFAELSPDHKLAWLYLLDVCDNAGVAEVNQRIDSAIVGVAVDWDSLVAVSDERLVWVAPGKLLVTKFVAHQYRELGDSNPHKQVRQLLSRHGLEFDGLRVGLAFGKPLRRLKDKDKDQDKDKDKDQDKGKGKDQEQDTAAAIEEAATESEADPVESIEPAEVREACREWVAYKAERRERYKPRSMKAFASEVRNSVAEHGPQAVVASMQNAMANQWKGWTHGLNKPPQDGGRGSPQRSLPMRDPLDPRGAIAANQAAKELLRREREKQQPATA